MTIIVQQIFSATLLARVGHDSDPRGVVEEVIYGAQWI